MNNLIIVGNGFDLYHGIPSSYRHFRCYLIKYHKSLFNELDTLFYDKDLLWSEFEFCLGNPNIENIRNVAKNCIDYTKETAGNYHTYQFIIEENLELIRKLIQAFKKWAKRLEKSIDLIDCPKINLKNKAKYINFNYTSILERVYGIDENNILYIHNKASKNEELIVGHNNNNILDKDYEISELFNINEESEEIENNYLQKTLKPVHKIIDNHKGFFESLHSIDKIFVLGHSLSDIDQNYFKKISTIIKPNAKWIVSYYNPKEKESRLQFFEKIKIHKKDIKIKDIEHISRFFNNLQ